jgi:hypothetical protein
MKRINAIKLISVILVIAVMIPVIGCGKKAAQEPTPTPTATVSPTATTPAEPTGETGTLSSLTGKVTVMRQGASSWSAATEGMKIGTGYSLRTGSDGYVLITFFDGSVMEVNAGTDISVEELSVASGGATTIRINQAIGNTLNRVENLVDSSSTYEVDTPAGSAVVRGTTESIQSSEDRTCVSVADEGDAADHSAELTNKGVTALIGEGMTGCCNAGGIPGTPFYTDSSDDPLSSASGSDVGQGGGCQDTCGGLTQGDCCDPAETCVYYGTDEHYMPLYRCQCQETCGIEGAYGTCCDGETCCPGDGYHCGYCQLID